MVTGFLSPAPPFTKVNNKSRRGFSFENRISKIIECSTSQIHGGKLGRVLISGDIANHCVSIPENWIFVSYDFSYDIGDIVEQ
jgi:hypothetical protein